MQILGNIQTSFELSENDNHLTFKMMWEHLVQALYPKLDNFNLLQSLLREKIEILRATENPNLLEAVQLKGSIVKLVTCAAYW